MLGVTGPRLTEIKVRVVRPKNFSASWELNK